MKDLMTILGLISLVIVVVSLITVTFMVLWNYAMPDVFSLPQITFLQSLALLLMSTIMFYKKS